MSSLPIPVDVPALPDDVALSQHIPDWPILPAIYAHLEGLTGAQLYAMKEFGETTLQQLTDLYARLKRCDSAFDKWYENGSPGWHAEQAAKPWIKWRIAQHKDLDNLCARIRRIQGEFTFARRQEGERLRAAQELEQAKAAPDLPVAVSLEQASVDLPKAPNTITATAVYGRTVTNWPDLLRWLADNPAMIDILKVTINFTALKYKATQIPGVKVAPLPDQTANRGK